MTKEMRENCGVSQKVMAIYLGTSRASLAKWETDPKRMPRELSVIDRLNDSRLGVRQSRPVKPVREEMTTRALKKIASKNLGAVDKHRKKIELLNRNLERLENSIAKSERGLIFISEIFRTTRMMREDHLELELEKLILERTLHRQVIKRAKVIAQRNELEGKIMAAERTVREVGTN